MGDLSAHFDRCEFRCKCGCGREDINPELVNKLEQLYAYLARTPTGISAIIITSGIRCPSYSVKVGGYSSDAHTKSIAADIYVVKGDKKTIYAPEVVAAVAEHIGFSGIGLMNGATHVDIRNEHNYINAHWFGDERNGNNDISTFGAYLPQTADNPKTSENKHKITVTLDGITILEKEF